MDRNITQESIWTIFKPQEPIIQNRQYKGLIATNPNLGGFFVSQPTDNVRGKDCLHSCDAFNIKLGEKQKN